MKPAEVLLAGIAGTMAFTLFSYVVAEQTGRPYKQPKLIGKLIHRTSLDLDKKESEFTGWLIHHLIGIGLAAIYKQIIDTRGIKPTLKNGAIAGAITGIPAALGWHIMLDMHPIPPGKKSPDYYLELFLGHIIFGATCFWVFKKGNRIQPCHQ